MDRNTIELARRVTALEKLINKQVGIEQAGGGGGSNHDILSATHTDTLTASVVAGDIIYGNATPKWARKAIAAGYLKNVGGLPDWATIAASDIGSGILALVRGGTGADLSATGGANQVVQQSSAGAVLTVAQLTHSQLGSVGANDHHNAVTLAADADVLLGLSTQQITLDSQSANTVLAGPVSGGATDPTFRALVAADIPVMVGDSGAGGVKGAAPAPGAGDAAAGKFLRADATYAVPSSGAWPFSNTILVDLTNPAANWDNLADACTAAVSGDLIYVGPGAFTGVNVQIPFDVNIFILDPNNTTFEGTGQYCIRFAGFNSAWGVKAIADGNEAGHCAGIFIEDDNCLLYDCFAISNNNHATGASYGIYKQGATGVELHRCKGQANSAGGTNNGLRQDTAAGSIQVFNGAFEGDANDIHLVSDVASIVDPVLFNGKCFNNGTIAGEAFDGNGHKARFKPVGTNAGRLTLTTGVPVLVADVTGATTGYFTPFDGAATEIYNGSVWIERPFAELSLAIPSTVYRLFDRFVYDNAGVLTLEDTNWNQLTLTVTAASNATPIVVTYTGTDPTNNDLVAIAGVGGNTAANGIWSIANVNAGANTMELEGSTGSGAYTSGGTVYRLNETRATALAWQDGKLVKSGATTRLYLGTGMTTGTSGQTEFVLSQPGNALLWNYYNRRHFPLLQGDTTSHTYTSATARIYRNVNTNKIGVVYGVLENSIITSFKTEFNFDAGDGQVAAGLSLNRTGSLNAANTRITDVGQFRHAMDFFPISQTLFTNLAAGYNFFQLVQTGAATSPDFVRSSGAIDFIG